MFNDNTSITLCGVTLLLFFVGGVTDLLSNPFYTGIIVLIYVSIIINILMVKNDSNDDQEVVEEDFNK